MKVSGDAKKLLGAAGESTSGENMAVATLGGLRIGAGNREFDTNDARSEARWRS